MTYSGRDPILLTPGPLTTSLATKAAMLRDWTQASTRSPHACAHG
jgi:aspartate aminotransferase-like enzyme